MSLFELDRTTEMIASEINTIQQQTFTIMMQAAVEIGKRLIEAKDQVDHGEWGQWLEDNVNYSQSKANDLMRIYREYGSNPQAFGNISYTKAVALLGVPEEEREEFAKEVKAEELSTRELQNAVKEKQRIEKEKKELEEQLKKAQQAHAESLEQMQLQLGEVKEQAAKAEQERGNNKRLEQELAVANSTVEQLQKDLKSKPIEAAAVVEVVPDDVQKELDALRAKADQSTDPEVVHFKFQFESLVNEFDKTLVTLDKIKGNEMHAKYQTAIHKLLDRMRASLEEE